MNKSGKSKGLNEAGKEKQKLADELIIANREKEKRIAELVIANEEKAKRTARWIIAEEEKAKRVAELVIANQEKDKLVAELVIANEEKAKQIAGIIISDKEKAKRVSELIIANEEKQKLADELVIANEEKQKRVAELVIADEEKAKRVAELVIAGEEKQKRVTELIVANEKLEMLLQLNADKDLFMSILAHDLRSPFSVLLGLSELLLENIRKYSIDEIENLINEITKSAKNTYSLLEDLLKWARMQSGNFPFRQQKLNLKQICDNSLEILNPHAHIKNISINSRLKDDINIFADIDMLKAIFRNIVSNALKFTEAGGQIEIFAEENNEELIITISDNGIGIKPDDLSKLFDISQMRTTSGTNKERGTGLGLLLCKEFVEKNGGKIWVESEYGKGSYFKFTMPAFTKLKQQ